MNKFLMSLLVLTAPALGASLKCEATRPALFANTTIETATADASSVVVEGTAPNNIVPEPGYTQKVTLKYGHPVWNWETGLTVSAMDTRVTTGMHASVTIQLPGLKKPVGSPALKAYVGTLSLLPGSLLVRPRVATKVPVRCFFRK